MVWPARRRPAAEIAAAVGGQSALYEPGTVNQYSNLGLALAGEVVAAAAGVPYAAYITATILEPLGMVDTRPAFPTELCVAEPSPAPPAAPP